MKRISTLFPAFSVAFGLIYVVCMHLNVAAFVYYPVLGEWHASRLEQPDSGPPMFYYGWLFYSLVGAAGFALLTRAIPQAVANRIWPQAVWIAPAVAIVASAYLMRIWF